MGKPPRAMRGGRTLARLRRCRVQFRLRLGRHFDVVERADHVGSHIDHEPRTDDDHRNDYLVDLDVDHRRSGC
jgi:hypothetical protein